MAKSKPQSVTCPHCGKSHELAFRATVPASQKITLRLKSDSEFFAADLIAELRALCEAATVRRCERTWTVTDASPPCSCRGCTAYALALALGTALDAIEAAVYTNEDDDDWA